MVLLFDFIHRQFLSEPPVPTISFNGRTIIVTGSNTGLGKEAVRWLVTLGAARVVLACRSIEKAKEAVKDIQATTKCSPDVLETWYLDMSSYASVLAFADKAKAELSRLDAVIANAGVFRRNFALVEGNEETINTNVISTTLLACLLHPKLHETAKAHNTQSHFTVTASELYEVAKFKERQAPTGKLFETLNDKNKSVMLDRYNVSKLLEILIVREIAAISPVDRSGVIVNCVAPGWCQSELARDYDNFAVRILVRIMTRKTEVGARTLVYGAGAGVESHGQYLPDCKITKPGALANGKQGAALQERVWQELKPKLEAIRLGVTSFS